MFQRQCQQTTVNSNFKTLSFQASLSRVSHIVQKTHIFLTKTDRASLRYMKNPPTLRTFQLNKMAAELSTLISFFLD